MILPLHNRYALDEENTIGVACISYGKDSLAELRAIEKLKLPLHRILHSEVWATPTIPADLPPMVEFKAKADEIIYQRYGIKVEHICAMQNGGGYSHTKICSTKKCQAESMKEHTEVSLLQQEDGAENSKLIKLTYQDIFYRQLGGGYTDSQYSRGIGVQSSREQDYGICDKVESILHRRTQEINTQAFSDSPSTMGGKNVVQYLGIAADEPIRIARHQNKKGIMMPLVELGWDEDYCGLICKYDNLLSPIYTTGTRGGCWFCHNQGVEQLRLLRRNYPDLWALLMKWDLDSPTTFKSDGHTVHDYDKRFQMEDEGIISQHDTFFWKYLDNPPEYRQLRIEEVM